MSDKEREDQGNDGGTQTVTRERTKVRSPKQYKVVLLNDDYTPMDFVVSVLETIFSKSAPEAVRIMLQVHNLGQGVCGYYAKQIAETKLGLVHSRAKEEGHPLRCTMEEA